MSLFEVDSERVLATAATASDIAQAPQRARTAMALIDAHPVGVIVSDLVVGGEHVAGMLKGLKAQRPEIVSLVLTPFQDVSLFVGLINQGQVYRLLPKPLRRGPLGASLASALRHHRSLRNAPGLRDAHRVEPIRDVGERSVAERVTEVRIRWPSGWLSARPTTAAAAPQPSVSVANSRMTSARVTSSTRA